MIRRSRRRDEHNPVDAAQPATHEIMRLQRRVARLERALERAMDTARQTRVNTGGPPPGNDGPHERQGGFAAAWTRFDAQSEMVAEDFFSAGHPDMRARSWLLTAS